MRVAGATGGGGVGGEESGWSASHQVPHGPGAPLRCRVRGGGGGGSGRVAAEKRKGGSRTERTGEEAAGRGREAEGSKRARGSRGLRGSREQRVQRIEEIGRDQRVGTKGREEKQRVAPPTTIDGGGQVVVFLPEAPEESTDRIDVRCCSVVVCERFGLQVVSSVGRAERRGREGRRSGLVQTVSTRARGRGRARVAQRGRVRNPPLARVVDASINRPRVCLEGRCGGDAEGVRTGRHTTLRGWGRREMPLVGRQREGRGWERLGGKRESGRQGAFGRRAARVALR